MKKQINGWNLELNQELVEFIEQAYQTTNVAPSQEKIYYALELTSISDVSVVIFGQDPYPTAGVATGLAFSSNNQLPASLRNMFKELEADLGVVRTDTNLADWARQGVLLFNTSLTVEVGNAGSHSKVGWQQVTEQVIDQINELDRKVIFVLLGGHAQKLKSKIDDHHVILEFVHPSPLAAYRGFFGSRMYSQINDNLETLGYPAIDFSDSQTSLF